MVLLSPDTDNDAEDAGAEQRHDLHLQRQHDDDRQSHAPRHGDDDDVCEGAVSPFFTRFDSTYRTATACESH